MIEDITKATVDEIKAEQKEIEVAYKQLDDEIVKKTEEVKPYITERIDNMTLLSNRYEELKNELTKRNQK